MKKVLISSALGVGGTGTGLAGCYAMGVFDGSAEANSSYAHFSGVEGYKKWGLHYYDVLNFKSQDAPDCVTSTFSGFKKIVEAPGYKDSSQEVKDAEFTFNSSKDSDGCVAIDWSREENKGSKYTGEVNFMWAFKQEGKGFISYVNLEFDKYGNDKAELSSLIYVLSGEGSDNKWTITSQYELTSDKNTEIDKDKLPKPGSALKGIANKNFWGMEMEGAGTNLVKKSDLGGGTTHDKYRGGSYWKWEGNKGSTKLNDWSSNLIDWWKEVFKSSNNKDLPSQLESITGNWGEVIIQPGLKLERGDD